MIPGLPLTASMKSPNDEQVERVPSRIGSIPAWDYEFLTVPMFEGYRGLTMAIRSPQYALLSVFLLCLECRRHSTKYENLY